MKLACRICTPFLPLDFDILAITLRNFKPFFSQYSVLTTNWTAGVRSPTEAEDFSSSLYVQTGSGAHPTFYTVGTGGSFPGGKARPERDADHSSPSSAEVKKE
jgi:hypothetical protein